MDSIIFEIRGGVYTKKNYRPRNARSIHDPFKAAHAGILLQIQNQWQRRKPFERATVEATFFLGPKRRGDGDGMLTTLLDLLKTAGVITDDNWRRIPRMAAACVPADDERIEVIVTRE